MIDFTQDPEKIADDIIIQIFEQQLTDDKANRVLISSPKIAIDYVDFALQVCPRTLCTEGSGWYTNPDHEKLTKVLKILKTK